MKANVRVIGVAATLAILAASVGMAHGLDESGNLSPVGLVGYLSITGSRQGPIAGDGGPSMGGVQTMEVLNFAYEVGMARGAMTARAAGRAQRTPLTILKPMDSASPRLMQALVTGEALPEVTLRTWMQTDQGESVPFMTIRLTNALLASDRLFVVPVGQNAGRPMEQISFTFERITWTHEPSGESATDEAMLR